MRFALRGMQRQPGTEPRIRRRLENANYLGARVILNTSRNGRVKILLDVVVRSANLGINRFNGILPQRTAKYVAPKWRIRYEALSSTMTTALGFTAVGYVIPVIM